MDKARARRDSVACDGHFLALDCAGATGLDMLATGDWRSAAALWAQCRYVGGVHISGHTAALWAAITASVYTANTRPSATAMNHIHNTMTHTHDTDFLTVASFSRSRVLDRNSSCAQRLGCWCQVFPRVGLFWSEWA